LLELHPDQVWSTQVTDKIRKTLSDYATLKVLKNGRVYGNSVRSLNIENKCLHEIELQLEKQSCERKDQFVKDLKSQNAVRTSDGKTIPLLVYLCDDGGVVKIKPVGDPTSRFRPQPHASKSLRYPYNSRFESFDDEVVKVNNSGRAVPKWAKDLNFENVPSDQKKEWIEDWANDSHSDLKLDCKN
jgi:hypothetical protein